MEILNFVREKFRRKSALFAGAAFFCFVAIILAIAYPCEKTSETDFVAASITYISCCCLCIGLVVQWIAISQQFRDSLKTPFRIYDGPNSKNELFADMLSSYSRRCYLYLGTTKKEKDNDERVADRMPKLAHLQAGPPEKHLYAYKVIFGLIWICLTLLIMASLWRTSLAFFQKAYLILLVAIAMILNGSSYSLCCAYVWFLGALSRCPKIDDLPHNKHKPIQTQELQELSNAAKQNTLTFLLVAVQFSLVVFLGSMLPLENSSFQPIANTTSELLWALCFLMVFIVGFATSLVLSQCSKIFLKRILDSWRRSSIRRVADEYNSEYNNNGLVANRLFVPSFKHAIQYDEAYAMIMQDSKMDEVDFLNIFLAAMSLLVNIAAFVVAISK